MTDCAHNDKSKYVDCATELLEARREVMRLTTENRILRIGMKGDYDLDAWLAWVSEVEEKRSN